MKLGLHGINAGGAAQPAVAARVARAAEAAGFDSLWTAEHVVLPDPQAPPSPLPPRFELLDPAVCLAFLAAHTQRIRLATGIIILPQRNPVVLAKELASVDCLSGGRLIFGVGAGYLEPEFRAIGAPFHERGPRTDEYIEAIRELWTSDAPRFQGRFVSFAGIQSRPRPVQQPHPPIVLGGLSEAALRRAWLRCNGWYGFAQDLEKTAAVLVRLRRVAQAERRPAELGELEITITPPRPLDPDTIGRYAELGVHRLVPIGISNDADAILRVVESSAEALEKSGARS